MDRMNVLLIFVFSLRIRLFCIKIVISHMIHEIIPKLTHYPMTIRWNGMFANHFGRVMLVIIWMTAWKWTKWLYFVTLFHYLKMQRFGNSQKTNDSMGNVWNFIWSIRDSFCNLSVFGAKYQLNAMHCWELFLAMFNVRTLFFLCSQNSVVIELWLCGWQMDNALRGNVQLKVMAYCYYHN